MKLRRIAAAVLSAVITITYTAVAADELGKTEPEVSAAIEVGLVPAELQGEYTDAITRAELTHIAVTLMAKLRNVSVSSITNNAKKVFSDTDDAYVSAAYEMGLINGKGNGIFAPQDGITRQEVAKVLVNTYAAYTEYEPIRIEDEFQYSDSSEISQWAYEPVMLMREWEVMNGVGDGRFDPLSGCTREQSIMIFLRLYNRIKGENASPDFSSRNPKITNMLRVSDGKLMSGGNEIVLNGVNLGGWLLMETWMNPIADEDENMAYTDVLEILESRFGTKETTELVKMYEDNFITDADFAQIEAFGFNCVRIPFWYRTFMTVDGEWLNENPDKNPGFMRLDYALRQCAKHGLYAILDMHGCPGGQSMNHSSGVRGKNELYNDKNNLETMEKLWSEIARRYKDNVYVAAYDIMNEPQNNSGYSGARAWRAESFEAVSLTNSVYDRMIAAIRKIDKNHIITVEGIWTVKVLPDPKERGWENMMYQLHIYDSTKDMITKRVDELAAAREKYGVAVFCGEYNNREYERYASDLYKKHGISRAKWTYKTLGKSASGWGLYHKDYSKINIETASLDEIKKAFSADLLTDSGFELDASEYNMIKS